MTAQHIAALGFRAHTGWAAAVVVTPDGEVVERRRIVYEPAATRFIYHHAAELACDDAATLIDAARALATDKAGEEIQNLLHVLGGKRIQVSAAGVPGGNTRLPEKLSEILAAHSRIHAAEGAFYRDVLADACARIGVRVSRVPTRDLWQVATASFGNSEEKLREHLAALGKKLGPPWSEDQKLAALAAFTALKTKT